MIAVIKRKVLNLLTVNWDSEYARWQTALEFAHFQDHILGHISSLDQTGKKICFKTSQSVYSNLGL